MMSDDEDLFGSSDGDDTDDLIAEANKKPVAKKKRLQKKSSITKKRKLPGMCACSMCRTSDCVQLAFFGLVI